jgi:DNA-binding CsgD family transcriptional regulator
MTIRSSTWRAADDQAGAWMVSVIESWHIGLVALSGSGRQAYTNRAARYLAASADGFALTNDGPLAANRAATRELRDLVRELNGGRRPGPEYLRLDRPSGAPSYEVMLHRVAGAGQDGPRVVMLIGAPDAPVVCDEKALRRLHRLTKREASVAECLARAMPMQEIAATLHLSRQTARWYVQQVREKMDAASQGEVIRVLLRGLATVQWPAFSAGGSRDDTRRPSDTSHLRGARRLEKS